MISIDLNSDMGEGYGNYSLGNDDELLKYVSSANIACGFHAGDPHVMRKTVIAALKNNVSVGAHPGYPDLQGFGRREIAMDREDVISMLIYQVGALKAMVESEGGRLAHVKAHGALYNSAALDPELADAISTAISRIDDSMVMFGLPGSCLETAAARHGLMFAAEAFADRGYKDDGTLASRSIPGALITDETDCFSRVRRMIRENRVISVSGNEVVIKPDTICLHGDNENAILIAMTLSKKLREDGVEIIPLKRMQ